MKSVKVSLLKQKLIKYKKNFLDYGTVFSYDMLNKFIAGLCNIIVVRMLTEGEYANYTVFNSIASVVSGMIGSGIATAYLRLSVKHRSAGENDDSGYYTFSLMVSFVLYMIVLIFGRYIGIIYKTSLLIVVLSIAEAAILSLCQLNLYVYQAREKYGYGGKIYNLRNIVIFCALVFVLFCCENKSAYLVMLSTIIAGVIALVMSFVFLNKLNDFKLFSISIKINEIRQLVFEMKWLVLYFVILALMNAVDVIVLSKITNSYYVANYGVAFKYYALFMSLIPSIAAVLRVKCSTTEFEESSKKRIDFLKNWIKKTSVIALIGMIIIPVVSYFLWDVINGVGYSLAYKCFVVFLLGAMMSYIFSPSINFLLSAGMHKKLCLIAFFALLFNLVGNYIMVNRFAAVGVTIITVVSQAILNCGGAIVLIIYDTKRN